MPPRQEIDRLPRSMAKSIDLNDKSILITGGTGSFGQRFVDYVLAHYRPRRLIILSRDETKQYEMASRLPPEKHPCLRYFIGDVRDGERLTLAMKGVDIVVHTAALKHVPIAEYNPFECISTNVYGTENVIRAAIACNVTKVLGLSTDKAVAPINLYGATKLASEKLLVAANNLAGADGPRFAVARYGNVVGSRGSVVPFFRELLARGTDHLPITDERMTRFWITLEDGVRFVLSSLEEMDGGEIFIPKLQVVRIVDLAEVMGPGIPQKIVGIRPGEKLHETLISYDEARSTVELEDRYMIKPPLTFWRERAPKGSNGRPVEQDFSYISSRQELLMLLMPLDRIAALLR
jgi:UDP-N-acetylglucosamine 4,6-dehydratase